MPTIKTKKVVCCKCKKPARMYYKKKWYCGAYSDFGNFNLIGYCKLNKNKSKAKK